MRELQLAAGGRQVAPTSPLSVPIQTLPIQTLPGWGGVGMGRVCLRDNGPPLHYYPVQNTISQGISTMRAELHRGVPIMHQ